MNIYVGTSGFAYREWKGKFYPEKISPGEMLRFYADRFDTVEINNTFYRMPKTEILASWAQQVSEDFLFALKAPQVITHLKQLRNAGADVEFFLRRLSVLETKLGPILFQFSRSFRADHALLRDFLTLIPPDISCAFDFRSPTWFDQETMDLLSERGFSLCLEDTDESPAEKILSTATWGYLRLRRSSYTDSDLSAWAEKIRLQQWKRAYVFFKHEEEAKGPQMAMRFRELAGQSMTKKRLAL